MDAMATLQTTLVLVKPDAVQRGLIGAITGRFESKGLQVVGMRLMRITRELAERHYGDHRGKSFFAGLIEYITSSPVVVMALRGPSAIEMVRTIMGPTNAATAPAGTIRGDYGMSMTFNLVHGSDGQESAAKELAIFFPEGLVEYERAADAWLIPAGDN